MKDCLRVIGFLKSGTDDLQFLNRHSHLWFVVKAALTAGFFPMLAQIGGGKEGASKNSKHFLQTE